MTGMIHALNYHGLLKVAVSSLQPGKGCMKKGLLAPRPVIIIANGVDV